MIIINPIDKKDNKCFQYVATVALNHDEIKKDLQAITTKIKTFIMFCMLKKKKDILLMFQNIIQIVKSKLFF